MSVPNAYMDYMDAVVAAAEVVGRSGGREFEVGWLYDDEDAPPGWPEGVAVPVEEQRWYATARWKGALLKGEGAWPWEACERLAARILHGGQCIACRQKINLVPEQGSWADGNCNWHREGKHWIRGCAGGHGSLQNRKQRRGR